jgi:non-canonical purine NTP pyrophosphatase (RdgB/HAM1 family)
VPKFILVTQSNAKIEEFSRLLGQGIDHEHIDLPEIQSLEPSEVAKHKARAAFEMLGKSPVLVEDTGLAVHAWNGLPGALIKWFLRSVGPHGICQMLQAFPSSAATAETAIAVCDGEVKVFSGKVDGIIAPRPAGQSGFGWDSIFIPQGATRTFSEMKPLEKDLYSMRRLAIDKLRSHYTLT